MGFFGIGGSKGCKKADEKTVQRSMDSVAVAKKRINKTKPQRDAEEQQWAEDEAEIKRMEEEAAAADEAARQAKSSTWTPKTEGKPPVKSAMKKKSKFGGEDED